MQSKSTTSEHTCSTCMKQESIFPLFLHNTMKEKWKKKNPNKSTNLGFSLQNPCQPLQQSHPLFQPKTDSQTKKTTPSYYFNEMEDPISLDPSLLAHTLSSMDVVSEPWCCLVLTSLWMLIYCLLRFLTSKCVKGQRPCLCLLSSFLFLIKRCRFCSNCFVYICLGVFNCFKIIL